MEDDLWWQALDSEASQYEEEYCEHGIHKDSGHPCLECLMNRSDDERE